MFALKAHISNWAPYNQLFGVLLFTSPCSLYCCLLFILDFDTEREGKRSKRNKIITIKKCLILRHDNHHKVLSSTVFLCVFSTQQKYSTFFLFSYKFIFVILPFIVRMETKTDTCMPVLWHVCSVKSQRYNMHHAPCWDLIITTLNIELFVTQFQSSSSSSNGNSIERWCVSTLGVARTIRIMAKANSTIWNDHHKELSNTAWTREREDTK